MLAPLPVPKEFVNPVCHLFSHLILLFCVLTINFPSNSLLQAWLGASWQDQGVREKGLDGEEVCALKAATVCGKKQVVFDGFKAGMALSGMSPSFVPLLDVGVGSCFSLKARVSNSIKVPGRKDSNPRLLLSQKVEVSVSS